MRERHPAKTCRRIFGLAATCSRFLLPILCLTGLAPVAAPAQATPTMAERRLCGAAPVFDDEFDSPSLSAWTLGAAHWITHTPWGGDFGDARFTDPGPGSAFSARDGVLSITARKDAQGHWTSGLLASADRDGHGFTTLYGYFETRVKLPPGPGTWPGIWLNESTPPNWMRPTVEVDTIEYYGQFTDAFHSTVHVWPGHSSEPHGGATQLTSVPAHSLVDGFHTYGTLVTPRWISFYLDHKEFWRTPTPPQHRLPFMFLVNLALGSGWSIDRTPNPTAMQVDYVRAYRPADPEAFARCLAAGAPPGAPR